MMPLLLHLRRRLKRAQNPTIFLSQLLNPRPHHTLSSSQLLNPRPHHTLSSSCASPSLPLEFSKAFHRTFIKPGNTSLQNLHFSTLQSSHIQHRYEIINFNEYVKHTDENAELGIKELIELTRKATNFRTGDEALDFLDKSGVKPNIDLIFSAILVLREEWKLAFLVFKWGEKWDCIVEKSWCLIIWVLGNHRKFGTAWSLIHDLQKSSADSKPAIFVMIDRYVAANSVDKAMKTFKIMEKVHLSLDQEAFFAFLNILCKHGNTEEAEEFMFLNQKFFPLETEGFNIILNGWCNITVDIVEAKRVWREMSKCCILPNGTSYTHLISCFSKVGNLFNSLRLYDEMKKRGFVPGIEVYNSLTYVLACQNCLKESLTILNKMKEEGLTPNSTTYNNIICPLCEATKLEEARMILEVMMEDNVSPTIDTYHAFLKGASLEGDLELLHRMRKAGLGPNKNTFIQILGKFFELKQPESALKVWQEMKQYEIVPDLAHYTLLVEGLAKCGLFVKAREFHNEMKSKGFVNDPKLEKLLKEPVSSMHLGRDHTSIVKQIENGNLSCQGKGSTVRNKGHRKNSSKKQETRGSNSVFATMNKR